MATTGGDVLVETIMDWGADVVFGLPGDGIDGVMEALRKRQDKVRFIHVRHEESAAFAACAYAKYAHKLGVCLGTSGPGGLHLLNGLYDAKLDQQPVVAITGMQYSDLIETYTQQDVELDKVFMDVCKYNGRVMGPTHVENVTELACRSSLAYRGVSHVTIPIDIQSLEVRNGKPSKRNIPHHVSDTWARSARLPDPSGLRKAADILNKGTKVAILAGQGALHATDELEEAAEMLGAPIVKALLGKAAVPDDSPYTTGQVGLLGTKPSQEVLEECDTILIVGSSFPYIEYYPKPGQAQGVQIDLDPQRIGLRYPTEVGLVGDSRESLRKLLPMLKRNKSRSFLKKAQDGMEKWRKLMENRGTRPDVPMKPEVVAYELGKRLSSTAIVSCDSGTIATWWARQVPVKRGQMHSVSGTLATMACGLPYAIGAQVAYPERESVAIVGDGGFSMLMADFSTCVKYNLPVKVIVFKNNLLGQIRWEQMVFLGNPEYETSLGPIDFAAFARACGGTGFTIDNPESCGQVLDQALHTPGPVVVEAVIDPNEPPMPAKIEPDQAIKLAEAFARGTPYRGKIAMTIAKDRIKELI
jgi:pyruvate dehydrogenase (quinone)/pyruvate oxidase